MQAAAKKNTMRIRGLLTAAEVRALTKPNP